jgi:hypothetical protein
MAKGLSVMVRAAAGTALRRRQLTSRRHYLLFLLSIAVVVE